MRTITRKAKDAFLYGLTFKQSNTTVKNNALFLHGHKILWKNERGNFCFCLCGYNTLTTRERLKAFLPIKVKRGKLYWDNIEINAKDAYELSHAFDNGIRTIKQ